MYHKVLINNSEDIKKLVDNSNIDISKLHCKISYPFNKNITDEDLQCLNNVHSINLHYAKLITNEGLENLGFPVAVDISRCKQLTNDGLIKFISNILQNNKMLFLLNLSNVPKINDKGLMILGKSNKLNLQELHLSNNTEITDESIKIIARNNNIRVINLSKNKKITNASLIELKHLRIGIFSKLKNISNNAFIMFRNLIRLNVSHNKHLNDDGVSLICNNINLEELVLSYCKKITNKCFEYIKNLTSLQTLNIDRCKNISDNGIILINKIVNLSLVGCKITDLTITHLCKIPELENLNIYGNGFITHQPISQLKTLKYLDASICALSDESIRDMINMEKLFLSGCLSITHYGLFNMKHLVHLDLSWCNKISCEGLIQILKNNPIENLSLNWCNNVSDECLKFVPNGRYFSLIGCKNITDVGVHNLCEGLLNLQTQLININNQHSVDKLNKHFNFNDVDDNTIPEIVEHDDYFFFGQKNKTHTLQYLDLSHCDKITDEGIKEIGYSMTEISSNENNNTIKTSREPISVYCLKINNTKITDYVLEFLGELHTLAISNCPNINGSGFKHLQALHTLNIAGNEINEEYVEYVSMVHKLLV